MKRILLLLVLSVATSMPSHGQLVLSPGEAYSYQFDTLPFNRRIVGQPGANYGYFYLAFAPSTFDAGDSIRLEFFENSLAEAPLRTMDFTSTSDPPIGIYVGAAWQDIQGAFRITQLSGSETVDSINVQAVKMNPDFSFNYYQQIVTPVPEPSVLALFVIAATALAGWRRWRIYCHRQRGS